MAGRIALQANWSQRRIPFDAFSFARASRSCWVFGPSASASITTSIIVSMCFPLAPMRLSRLLVCPIDHASMAAMYIRNSRDGRRCSVLRMLVVFTRSRRVHSAAFTSARVVFRRRVQSDSSAADITCAWMPQTSRQTSTSDAFEPLVKWWRARRNAATRSAVNDLEGIFDRPGDDVVDAVGQRFRVMRGRIRDGGRLYRVVHHERDVRGFRPQTALRHHVARAHNRERHDWQPGLNRQQETAGLEPGDVAVGCPGAFGIDDERQTLRNQGPPPFEDP